METHHQEAIEIFLKRYKEDEKILAILLGGSLVHGFSVSESDIDILIVVTVEEFEKRKAEKKLAFSIWDICTYEHGYIDCKVVDLAYLDLIAERGSDASRYAFKDNKILFSRIDGIDKILERIVEYPIDQIEDRRKRFASQLLAWRWFFGEGVNKNNVYLQTLAIQKIVLFAARIVLNENRLLYPFHKWMLKELENAPRLPENMIESIHDLLKTPDAGNVNNVYKSVFEFIGYNEDSIDWPNYFMTDSEQNWIESNPPVDDL